MRKRILSLLLCLAVLLSMALPVHAENPETPEEVKEPDLVITNVKDFLAFAENCRLDSYSMGLYAALEADLDLAGTDFAGVPVFCGQFDGGGHSISGLELTGDGSAQGLFRYLTDTALVQDLHIEGDLHPGGTRNRVGGIAGQNSGSIVNCSFTGTVSGSDYVGGITGSNTVTGIIEECTVSGELYGEHFVGGIAGENLGVIRNSENHALINTTAQQNSVKITDISLDTLTSSEAVNTVTDIAGIAGSSTGVIRACINHGDVGYKHMGYNIGGIAGTQSGYVTECENYGFIQGRKEVGGIVGQMEPASVIEYTEDTLQILQGQLNTMGGLVNRASYNAQSNAAGINTQLGALQNQTQNAREAVESLIPDRDNPQIPDQDTLLAAQNTLNNSFNGMTNSIRGIASAAQSTVSGLTRDLQAVSNQIGAMSSTISQADENVGGTITDVSDLDTEEDLTGKVELSVNYGQVLGELNIGGIAGAMAVENDADIWEDWEQTGEQSLNFDSELRAVVLNCENRGNITCQKQNAGGIAGWQSMGLVKNSINTGKIAGGNADYVGGISGMSTGFIRACSAKCEILGNTCAGGIAGSATIVSDSLAMVKLVDVSEQAGAILGQQEQPTTEEENPITRNFYLNVEKEVGAIDGISYAGMAEPLSLNYFLVQEDLENIFKVVTIRFLYEDGQVEEVTLAPGGRLNENQIPEVPEKAGYSGQWEGLAEAELTNILFDMQFETVYTPYRTTIESAQTGEGGLPLMFLEGSFTDAAELSVETGEAAPALEEGEVLLHSWRFTAGEPGHTVRLWIGEAPENGKLLVGSDGQWRQVEYSVDGSYLVFSVEAEDTNVCLVQQPQEISWQMIAIAGAAGAVLLVIVIVLVRKHSKKKRTATEQAK